MTGKKNERFIALLFSVTYMISYITRTNYSAVIAELEGATAIPRELLSLPVTGSFIAYGAGQVISGMCGDRLSPKRLVLYGLITTVCMNVLMPFCKDVYQMLVVWCVNGLAQSFMWPPMVRMMTEQLSEEEYKRVSPKVSWGSSLGTVMVYLMSPLIISLLGWRAVFWFSAICGAIMAVIWSKYARDTGRKGKKVSAVPKALSPLKRLELFCSPLMLGIMIAILLQGMLRDGISTWMPSYISETYNLSSTVSILTGVILPLFNIVCFYAVTQLYIKKLTNPISCAAMLFGMGAASAAALYLLSGLNAAVSVLFFALLSGCVQGVNLMLTCMVPALLGREDNVATVSGVLNSCTYIGSAAAAYGTAALSMYIGWSKTILMWLFIASAGLCLCALCVKLWENKLIIRREDNGDGK